MPRTRVEHVEHVEHGKGTVLASISGQTLVRFENRTIPVMDYTLTRLEDND